MASPGSILVLAGGDAVDAALADLLPPADVVIAADSGLLVADVLGLRPDLVVGDFDSVDPDRLALAERDGCVVDRHPVDKDRTDLAIALDAALRWAPARVTVVGGHGGRLDHHLANALLLASPRYDALEVTAYMGTARLTVVHDEVALTGHPGDLVSLLPAHGDARGVTTDGLRFPLHGEDLLAGSSRGVSNVLISTSARVRVDAGRLLVVQPSAADLPA